MKKSFLFMLMMLATVSTMRANNILVVYFSWGGNTQALAEEIQRQTGGDIYRIDPTVPYTTDYNTLAYTVARNEKDANARPALKETDRDFSQYNYIFGGCPVWWFDVPMIMHSFLETYSFSGKTVIPFCTYYTAEYETLNDIVRATSNSNHLEGLGIRGASSYDSNTIGTWLRSIGLDSETTAIDNIEAADKQQQGDIYNLSGQKVRNNGDTAGLVAGVYIMRGRKYYIQPVGRA